MIHRVLCPSRPEFRPGAHGVRAVLFSLVLVPWVTTCTPVGGPSVQPGPAAPVIPSIEEGTLPRALEEEGAQVLAQARGSLASGDFEGAREAARNIIRSYPGAVGSGEALEILARALLALEDPEEALEPARRYLGLLDSSHPAFPGALVLVAQALSETGDQRGAGELLLQMPADADPAGMGTGLALLRETAGQMDDDLLRELTQALPPRHPMWGVLTTELAVSRFLAGDREEARRLATAALAEGVGAREAELCEGILEGTLEELLGQPVILGAIVPRSDVSPGVMEYAEWILEGVQVAVEEFQGELRRPVELEVVDDRGDPAAAIAAVRTLEGMGAVGVVGPLTADLFREAASARRSELPIVSPFASLPGGAEAGVYSLSGPDPRGAEAIAGYAWDLGLEKVVILRPGTEESGVEGSAFRDTFQTLGGSVPREIVYDSGATFFQGEFQQVASILPDGLFLPLDPRDVQVLAPQFTFFGLDTLGIQVLGTAGWTEDEVVLEVDSRHTDGVIASTTRTSQDDTEAFTRFRQGYEALFQKTLRSQVPAYGYDAAALLLMGLRDNPRSPRELLEAMSRIRDFSGATGRLTVEGGRILRDPHLVRIQNHELIYISPRYD